MISFKFKNIPFNGTCHFMINIVHSGRQQTSIIKHGASLLLPRTDTTLSYVCSSLPADLCFAWPPRDHRSRLFLALDSNQGQWRLGTSELYCFLLTQVLSHELNYELMPKNTSLFCSSIIFNNLSLNLLSSLKIASIILF